MEIRVKVNSTYNNTIVTALHKDRILKTISTGSIGFKKAKRASTLAAQAAGESLGYWLLLLDKALSQKTPLSGTPSRTRPGPGGSAKNTETSKVQQQTVKSLDSDSSNAKKGSKTGTGGFSSGIDSLESVQIKELSNPKLKIPNAKLATSGGSLSIKDQKSGLGSKSTQNKGKQGKTSAKSLDSSQSLMANTSSSQMKPAGLAFGSARKHQKNTGSLACIKPLSVMISGVGHGKFGAIKGLAKMGIKIKRISEITAIPHNGCKPPKMRRK